MGGRIKGYLINGVVLLTAGVVACLIVEAGVRLFRPQEDIAEWFWPDPVYGHVLKPNFHQRYAYPGGFIMDVQTNALGFRDVDHIFESPFDGKTIVVLGDSFVFGYGVNVEDRFDTRLESRFDGNNAPVRIVNTGVPGWGTANETRFAIEHLELFQPDCVVLVFCGNDPGNDRGVDLPTLPDTESMLYWPKYLLRRHTHTYRLVMKQLAIYRHAQSAPRADESIHVDAQSAGAIAEKDWVHVTDTIVAFHGALTAHNPDATLIVMASNPEDGHIRARLATLGNGAGCHFLDWADLASTLSGEQQRTPWDGHWSPAMHDLAAEALYELLMTTM